MRRTSPFPVLLLLLASGCDLSDQEQILGVEASGSVAGLVFLDRDGDQLLDPAVDGPVPGVGVSLVLSGGQRAVARVETNAIGEYWIPSVPVGSYRVELDSAALGDTLRVLEVGPREVVISAGDTAAVVLAVGRPLLTVAEARAAPAGRKVTLEGTALNDVAAFGDATVHIADGTGSIRAVQVRADALAVGDSLRLIGATGEVDGEPALLEPEVFLIGRGRVPDVTLLSTGEASGAAGGTLDAAQVRITDAEVLASTVTAEGDVRLQVDDGTGMLDVVLDQQARITSEVPVLPGARITATGLLVPTGEGRWRLKPRVSRDVEVRVPHVDAATLRGLSPGRFVAVEGVALNGWAVFADATIHLADTTGAVLAVQVPNAFVFTGDSIRVLGVVGIFNGRAALVAFGGAAPALLGRTEPPAPVALGTGAAATAGEGELDAALVRVTATVSDTTSFGTNAVLTVDDGSGPLTVVLSSASGLSSRLHPPGARLELTGLLTPAPGGRSWALRPRTREDVVERK